MKKKIVKKIAVFACAALLIAVLAVVAFAEEGAGGGFPDGENAWDLWSLLNPENLNFLLIIRVLLTTLFTIIRAFRGDGFKNLWQMLLNMLRNVFAG